MLLDFLFALLRKTYLPAFIIHDFEHISEPELIKKKRKKRKQETDNV